jgi:molecular chaperone GrpE
MSEDIKNNEEVLEETTQEEVKENKKDKKRKNKNDCEQQVGEITEKYQRLLADMENLRRRTDEEKADSYKYRASGFIIEILPTIDMLESALSAKDVSDEVRN